MRRTRQNGVALIAAVLVVALATVLIAALLDRGEASLARSRNLLRAEQGRELMRGLEEWAALALWQDHNAAPGIDHGAEAWAQDLPPIELPGVRIQGRMRERNGCFNLNNLYPNGNEDAAQMARFERLLTALKLDTAIAAQAADWIDDDTMPRSQGAEDSMLLGQSPPRRTANRPFMHVSELRLLPAVNAEVYARLAPEVCALPAGSMINLNFASPALWMSLSEQITPSQASRLSSDGHTHYTSLDAVERELEQLGLPPLSLNGYSVASDWFVLEAHISFDGIPAIYSSLLHRRPDGTHIIARTQGRL